MDRPDGPRITFTRPPLEGLVASLLGSVPSGRRAPALAMEMWADRLATTLYAPGEMPEEFYADLAEALLAETRRAEPHPGTLPAVAALAHALVGLEADPLRQAHAASRVSVGPDDDSDLGIGRAIAQRALAPTAEEVDEPGSLIVVDFRQPTEPHSVAVHVDEVGRATDLFLGPPWDDDGPELTLSRARALVEAALDRTDRDPDPLVTEELVGTRPLVERRLALLPDRD